MHPHIEALHLREINPISESVANTAQRIIDMSADAGCPEPHVSHIPSASVQLEWTVDDRELEIACWKDHGHDGAPCVSCIQSVDGPIEDIRTIDEPTDNEIRAMLRWLREGVALPPESTIA